MNRATKQMDIDDFSVSIEPVFYCGLRKNSRVPDCVIPERVFDFFECRLKQNPKDLSCHLQRIQFALSKKDGDKVFAAICDLFIILGSQGLPLRQRVSLGCKKILDQKQIEILNSHLVGRVLTDELASLPDNCLFKKRSLKLIQLRGSSTANVQRDEDVLLTADSYIENSQFEAALEYMVAHLENDPENRGLTMKLIELYKTLGYANEFQNAYHKFANHLMTSQYWDDAKKYFVK